MSKPNNDANAAKTPEEMSAKFREDQGRDMENWPEKRTRNEGGPGNSAPMAPICTSPDGGAATFRLPEQGGRSCWLCERSGSRPLGLRR